MVELNAVKNLQIKEGQIKFDIETTASGPAVEELRTECERRLSGVEGVTAIEIGMKTHPKPAQPAQPSHAHAHASRGPAKIALPTVRNVIAVASGKGGVGKSTVTSNLAVALKQRGARVGLLDADIYGPSIPLMFGVKDERPREGEGNRVSPVERDGIKLMSMGFMVPDDRPVISRGPMVHGALTQFMTQVDWGELDYLLIDMPPGTGDAQLTISQSAPLTGAIIVTTPQEVSLIDARKGLQMFENVSVPILGVVENMAGFVCGHCEEVTHIFKKGGGADIAKQMSVPLLGSIPLDPRVTEGGDVGDPIVHRHPQSQVAEIYRDIADAVVAQLDNFKEAAFKPLSLEWQ